MLSKDKFGYNFREYKDIKSQMCKAYGLVSDFVMPVVN